MIKTRIIDRYLILDNFMEHLPAGLENTGFGLITGGVTFSTSFLSKSGGFIGVKMMPGAVSFLACPPLLSHRIISQIRRFI